MLHDRHTNAFLIAGGVRVAKSSMAALKNGLDRNYFNSGIQLVTVD